MVWRRGGGRRLRPALAGLALLVLAGCSAEVGGRPIAAPTGAGPSAGSPSPDTSASSTPGVGSSAPAPVGPSGRPSGSPSPSGGASGSSTGPTGTGDYPTTPLSLPATASGTAAALLEARRIGAFVPVPTFVIPAYSEVAGISTYPLKGPDALNTLFTDPVPSVARRAGMVTGFSASRHDKNNDGVVLAAFEFPSAMAATAAATAMAAADADRTQDRKSPSIPGSPGAVGRYYLSGGKHTMSFFRAQGAMVLYTWAESGAESTTLDVVGRMLGALATSFASFTPTGPQRLTALPVDQDGVLAHTLPEKGGDHTVYAGLYAPTAVVHYFSEPAEFRGDVTGSGVDLVALGAGQLYRTANADAAVTLRDATYAQSLAEDKDEQPYALPGASGQVKCWQKPLSAEYDCIGVHGRYVYDLPGTSETDIAQAVAAQEAILSGF